jgi:pimeloyl-ACP methyl ester carboxylesterase
VSASASPRSGLTRFVARGGHRLSYEVHGEPGGTAVLGLHDLLADRAQFRPLAAALTSSGFRVLLPDARGHGASPTISGRTYPTADLIDDALAVLDAEATAPVVVVAAGWGAASALGLISLAPARVSALVLVEPYLPAILADFADGEASDIGSAQRHILAAAIEVGKRGQLDRALDLVFGARVGEDWRMRMPKPAQAAARRNAVNLAPLLAGFLADRHPPGDLASIATPVAILLPVDASPVVRFTAHWLAGGVSGATIDAFSAGDETADERGMRIAALVRAVSISL